MNAARRAAAERTASSASEQETMKANTSTGMSLNVSSIFAAILLNTNNIPKPFFLP